LSGVYRRKRSGNEVEGLQRFHDEGRSVVIRDYVKYGYPYSDIKPELRTTDNLALRKPGWLPTAIVVNILTKTDVRRGRKVAADELITFKEKAGISSIVLPYEQSDEKWSPTGLEPIEVIDGQHRLWAFDEAIRGGDLPGDFELPVVAFHGLDIGWQAYLFWSINVSPKRISPSHAFDLYPLLRSQDWLETQSDLKIYREARAQELTELMYLHPQSPWFHRINMLGDAARNAPASAGVTQAGWVRGLSTSFLSPGGRGRGVRGLFASAIGDTPLDWPRPQQSALLIDLWHRINKHIEDEEPRWAKALRSRENAGLRDRAAREDPFSGTRTILNQEQGLRGVLWVANQILYAEASEDRALFEWEMDEDVGTSTTIDDVTVALANLRKRKLSRFVQDLADALSEFDWRTAEAPKLTDHQRLVKRAYRGSGGYVALRDQLLAHIAKYDGPAGERAAALQESRGS
jgi:DGQHR domain-containing protein